MQKTHWFSLPRSRAFLVLLMVTLALSGCPLGGLLGPTEQPYDAPAELAIVATGRDSVTLTWTEVSGVERYRVIFNTTGNESDPYETREFTAGDSPWIVDGLSGADPIYFAVQAVGPDGDGLLTGWVQATLLGPPDVYAYTADDPGTHLNDGDALTLSSTTVGDESELDLILENGGTATLTVSSVTTSGVTDEIILTQPDGSDVTVPFQIAPGDTRELLLTFAPAEDGVRSIEIAITSDDPDENQMVLTVSGTATAAPAPELRLNHPTPSGDVGLPNGTGTADFGDLGLGRSATYYVDIDNNGTSELTVSSIDIQGTNESEFSLTSLPSLPLTIPTGAQPLNRFGVVFSPQSLGIKTASLVLTSNDTADDPYVVQISGRGVDVPARISVGIPNRTLSSGDVVSFDEQEVGATSTDESLFLGNAQGTTVDLTIADVSLSGSDPDQFRVSVQATVPLAVAPGSYARSGSPFCYMYFEPTSTGDKSATLTISTNDPDNPEFEVVLTGTAIAPAIPAAPALSTPTHGDAEVTLSWFAGDTTVVDFYRIYFSETNDFSTAVSYAADGTYTADNQSVTVSGLTNDVTYYFWVTAVNASGESAPSTSRAGYPRWSDAPGEVGSVILVPGDEQFTVSWGPADRASYYVVRYFYRIWQVANGHGSWYVFDNNTVVVDGLSYVATGVRNDKEYRVSVMPMNWHGQGISSGTHLVTPSATATGPSNAELAAAVASVYSSLAASVSSDTAGATDLDPDPTAFRYEFNYPDGSGGSCSVVYVLSTSPTISTTITYDFNGYTSEGYVFDTSAGNELTYVIDGASNGAVSGRIDISGSTTGYVEYDLTITGGVLSGNYIVNGESIPF